MWAPRFGPRSDFEGSPAERCRWRTACLNELAKIIKFSRCSSLTPDIHVGEILWDSTELNLSKTSFETVVLCQKIPPQARASSIAGFIHSILFFALASLAGFGWLFHIDLKTLNYYQTFGGDSAMSTSGDQRIVSDKDGQYRRPESQFRNFVSAEPGARFPAERDCYALYISVVCSWSHRANIVRSLKGLEDVIQLISMDARMGPEGPEFYNQEDNTFAQEPLCGFTKLRQLYEKADPQYTGRCTFPTLWDKKQETIVSNESSEIIRMFYTQFDHLISPELREDSRPLLPPAMRDSIDEMNDWVYRRINNGV